MAKKGKKTSTEIKIRKPTAPPTRRHGNKKREEKSDLAGRKAKYGSVDEIGEDMSFEDDPKEEKNMKNDAGNPDPFDLNRFLTAQEDSYEYALRELENGRKTSHWMWYIFPQIIGLGHSSTTRFYAIKSPAEARAYLEHPVLGKRLLDCTEAVLGVEGKTVSEIFGFPDDLKLGSSMTLFETAAEPGSVFSEVLERYFQGRRDDKTLSILESLREE